MAKEFIGADKALSENPEISVMTAGISMRPLFREHKDIVIIERVTRPLKKGDVILYRRKGWESFILHRLIKITDNGLVIRGDNLYYNEYDIKREDVIGVLKAFYRGGKYCECESSSGYKLYTKYIILSYPLRLVFTKCVRRPLGKLKRNIKRCGKDD